MRNTRLYILLTTVLFFAMSSVLGFCGIGSAMADVVSYLEEVNPRSDKSSQMEMVSFDVPGNFFEKMSETWVRPNTFTSTHSQLRGPARRISVHLVGMNLLTHFIQHRYFNRSALPFIFLVGPAVNRHYLQFLRVLII